MPRAARTGRPSAAREKIHLSIDTAAVHLFDPTSGATLSA